MSRLSSRIAPALLRPERPPEYAPHHNAKHKLIREYANVWLPKLGFSYPQVAIVDGYASAGRYRDRQPGSPLILLHAYLGRSDHHKFQSPPHFVFIEERRAFAAHLQAEVDALDLKGTRVDVIHGAHVDRFPMVVEWLAMHYRQPLPTFVFIDPLGYKGNPFSHLRLLKRQLPKKSEVLVYVPASWMARFARTGITANALDELYSNRSWEKGQRREAGPLGWFATLDALPQHSRWSVEWYQEALVEPTASSSRRK